MTVAVVVSTLDYSCEAWGHTEGEGQDEIAGNGTESF